MTFGWMFKGIPSDKGRVLDTDAKEELRQEWRCLHVDIATNSQNFGGRFSFHNYTNEVLRELASRVKL